MIFESIDEASKKKKKGVILNPAIISRQLYDF